jgi:hypothetical protein
MPTRFPERAPSPVALAGAGLALLMLGAGPALAGAYGPGSSLPFLDPVIDWIGLKNVDDENLNLLGGVLAVFAGFFGYFSHLLLKDRGLGMILNGAIGVAGIGLALHFVLPRLPLLPGVSEEMRFSLAVILGGCGAPLFLLVASLFKNVFLRRVNGALGRVGLPPRPQPFQREPDLDPRIAAALRKKVQG